LAGIEPAALNGQKGVECTIAVAGGQVVSAKISAKSVRKVINALAAGGEYAVVLQGRLQPGGVLADASIYAQARKPPATAQEAQ
jgi:hypothetical protein